MSPNLTPTVAAVLSPEDRNRAEAAGAGSFSLIYRNTVRDALRMVRERPVDAVLISVDHCAGQGTALLEQFSRRFPAVPTVALVTNRQSGDAETLLRLGATGVRTVVEATNDEGWRRLRDVLGITPAGPGTAILAGVIGVLGPLSSPNRRFWETMLDGAPQFTTVERLADSLRVTPSTFVSRFIRNGLASPKDHLVSVRLCHAARLFDDGDLTVSDVAYRLEYASPQSFGRHTRATLGITPSEFRNRFPFCIMLQRFLDHFVIPHRETWQWFSPLAPGRRDAREGMELAARLGAG